MTQQEESTQVHHPHAGSQEVDGIGSNTAYKWDPQLLQNAISTILSKSKCDLDDCKREVAYVSLKETRHL